MHREDWVAFFEEETSENYYKMTFQQIKTLHELAFWFKWFDNKLCETLYYLPECCLVGGNIYVDKIINFQSLGDVFIRTPSHLLRTRKIMGNIMDCMLTRVQVQARTTCIVSLSKTLNFVCFSWLSCRMSTGDAGELTCNGLVSCPGGVKLFSACAMETGDKRRLYIWPG